MTPNPKPLNIPGATTAESADRAILVSPPSLGDVPGGLSPAEGEAIFPGETSVIADADPLVATLGRYARSWPQYPEGEPLWVVRLSEALTHPAADDRHMVAYGTDKARRLNSGAVGQVGIEMVLAVFDVDGPGHQWSLAWWLNERIKVEALLADHPGAYVYVTRGGYRIVYRLPSAVPIATEMDGERWTARYVAWLGYLAERYNIVADESCDYWQCLFRLPRVMRDGVVTTGETIGDAGAIGVWDPAVVIVEPTPRPAREPSAPVNGALTFDLAVEMWSPESVITDMGDQRRAKVQCPWATEHTTGGSDAMIFERDGVLGFKCLHSHCVDRQWRQYRAHHDPSYVDLSDADATREAINSIPLSRSEGVPASPIPDERDVLAVLTAVSRYRGGSDTLRIKDAALLDHVVKSNWFEVARNLDAIIGAVLRRVPEGTSDDVIVSVMRLDDPQEVRDALSRARQIVPVRQVLAEFDGDKKDRASQVINLVGDKAYLFRCPKDTAYAHVDGQTFSVDSEKFKDWIQYQWFAKTGGACSSEALAGVVAVMRAQARYEGDTHPVYVRVGELNGKTYVDLADELGRVVEIDGDGHRVLERSPVYFVRPAGMLPLVAPVRDPDIGIDRLWHFANVPAEDRGRVMAWLVSAFRAQGPYYALVLTGLPGAAKSSTARALRWLLDPNAADLRTTIGTGRDVMISARKSWVQIYDNQIELTADQSNALCCLATGGGYSTRTLRTDDEETILDASRPVILTSVREPVTAPDLLDRSIRVSLPSFCGVRRTDEEIKAEFAEMGPAMLGALLDLVAKAIRDLPVVRAAGYDLPRMASPAMFAVAALGPDVLRSLRDAAEDDHQTILEASNLSKRIQDFATQKKTWRGSATELLDALNAKIITPPKDWPAKPNLLSGQLKELLTALASVGVVVTMGRGKTKYIEIKLAEAKPENSNQLDLGLKDG